MSVTSQTSIHTYHPALSSLVVGIILIPILILLTWPVAAMLGDGRTLVVEFVVVPLFCVVVLGTVLHGFSFVFDREGNDLTIQRRVFFIRTGDAIRTEFANITDIQWSTDGLGNGLLYVTLNGKTRFAVTLNRTKAIRIQEMVARVHPNLHPQPIL